MKKAFYIVLTLSIITSYAFAGSVAMSELPISAVKFAETYFPNDYLYRAMEMGGSYTLIFKGGLKIYVNGKGEWNTINGGGSEISIEYLDDKVKNNIRKEFPDIKIVSIQKNSKGYKLEFMNRKKATVDFEGNVIKR